ncbi:MAG TPA: hypothetical protein VNO70_12265 [Blastocatellia bacterium]|nr:hypothetical protein [Blastocatellia bacterium]
MAVQLFLQSESLRNPPSIGETRNYGPIAKTQVTAFRSCANYFKILAIAPLLLTRHLAHGITHTSSEQSRHGKTVDKIIKSKIMTAEAHEESGPTVSWFLTDFEIKAPGNFEQVLAASPVVLHGFWLAAYLKRADMVVGKG